MKFYLVSVLLLTFYSQVYSQKTSSEWLDTLKRKIILSEKYDDEKLTRIYELYHGYTGKNKTDLYEFYLKLYDEYSFFNFDSAFMSASKLHELSYELNDPVRTSFAKMKLSFVLLSSGMFKEVLDSLSRVKLEYLNVAQKAEYYILMARCYYDIADYSNDNVFSPRYNIEAGRYIDSSLNLLPVNSFGYSYYSGLKEIRLGNDDKAAVHFKKIIDNPSLSPHEIALVTSTYADIFTRKDNPDTIIKLLCKAAIADIETSTKENSAIFNLATLLYKLGDIENASLFIQKASVDAQLYGARQRMVKLNSVMPLIDAEKLSIVESNKKKIVIYAVIITFSFLILIFLAFIIIKQVKKLKAQQQVISKKNKSLQDLLSEKENLLEEKEWLRKEIHHRVKNNLHTVLSLLESQSVFLKDEALAAIQDCQHRVHSMALLHQKLYQSENLSAINMSVYLPELINYLSESFNIKERIRFHLQIEPLELEVSLAVPLGLILNEAITNAIKYAFKRPDNNDITISMSSLSNKNVSLTVSDNGIGLPEDFDVETTSSLGIKLMKGLTEDIGGSFTIEGKAGCKITILFSIDNSLLHKSKML
ncbi:sensor histidine kinase [Lacibacter sediminis]|uniref:histidine kinase n=1 Tax=Lacibacter sediminis TaxID=2760713 RepID=A0A7G5XK91_9BACT|nr:sensor histidine kinase [Lacibacter sediminis]QNA45894.1 sensor histidine kinase [Lacibacter sediminis]